MLRKLFFVLSWCFIVSEFAQSIRIKDIDINMQQSLGDMNPKAYVLQKIKEKAKSDIEVKLVAERNSGIGKHYTFMQEYRGLPVFGTFLKLSVSHQGEILSLYISAHQTEKWSASLVWKFPDTTINSGKLAQQQYGIYVQNNQPIIAIRAIKFQAKPLICEEHIFDHTHLYQVENRVRNFKDTTIQVKVFYPDPLTTAKVYYGPPYKDYNDTNSMVFENAEKQMSVKASYDETNKLFLLQDSFKRIVDFQDPINVVPQLSSPNFFYNRSQKEFESVSAFYHIHQMEQYIKNLGLSLRIDKLSIDGHGKEDDNSAYIEEFTPRIILYGEGGVDDAEDADVVVHEYLHYVSSQASPLSNTGFERQAIDEGLADYFACAYSKNIDDFRWRDMFTWDGHNEFWKGRNLNNQRRYSDSLVMNDRHTSGLILAGLLADLHEDIGRNATDLIQLNSMFSYFPDMGYTDVADLLLQTEKALYKENFRCLLLKNMRKRGLTSPEITLDCYDPNLVFESDITSKEVCKSDPVLIGVSDTAKDYKGYNYTWYPTDYLTNYNTSNPLFQSDKEFTYQVTVCDKNGKCNNKNVTIGVKICHTTVDIYNTNAFHEGGDMVIRLPDNDPGLLGYVLQVYNEQGKFIMEKKLNSSFFQTFNRSELPAVNGLYLLRLLKVKNNDIVTEKLIKVINQQ